MNYSNASAAKMGCVLALVFLGMAGFALWGAHVFAAGPADSSALAAAAAGNPLDPSSAVASVPAPVVADADAEGVPDKLSGGIDGYISLDLRDIDIVDALKFFAQRAGLNIVTTKGVAGRVTLMVENVLVRDVLDIMLRSNKLAYGKTGNIFSVMTEDEYKAIYGKIFSDTRAVETFRLSYAIPEQAFSLFDSMKSNVGRVLVDAESGSVMVMDIPEKIQQMHQVLEDFEKKNEVRIFPLQYAKAKDVEDTLKSQLDNKKVGLIRSDERGNQVIVQTLPGRMDEIERMIRELDVKTREVIIETTIIKLKFTSDNSQGINWEGLFDLGGKSGLMYMGSTPFATINPVTSAGTFTSRRETFATEKDNVGSYPFSGTTSSLNSSVSKTGFEEIHLGTVTANDMDLVIKYVESFGKTKILANPKLVVTNNQESRIHVGERQAYVTTTTTTGQATNTVAENVSFVDIGIQLAITPTINPDGYVTMKVKAEVSAVTDTLVTPTQNKIPIVDTSLAETTVMVKDGTTIVMAGLKRDERADTNKRTPFLGAIPFLGSIFKDVIGSSDHTELIILLTPKIIGGDVFVGSPLGEKREGGVFKGRQEYVDLRNAKSGQASKIALRQVPEVKMSAFKGLKGME